MIKILLGIFCIIAFSQARENPFFPSAGEKDMAYTSNEVQTLAPLKRATITLPPQARVLQKVTLEYKNLDGSIESRSIELENAVDWHLPVFISQSYNASLKEEKAPKRKKRFKKLMKIKYASFYSAGKTLKIVTKDKIIREFLLVQPHRIVIDFKRDTNLKTILKEFDNNQFRKIRIGNHAGYYRVVIELDGYYRYKMKKIKEGYTFELR